MGSRQAHFLHNLLQSGWGNLTERCAASCVAQVVQMVATCFLVQTFWWTKPTSVGYRALGEYSEVYFDSDSQNDEKPQEAIGRRRKPANIIYRKKVSDSACLDSDCFIRSQFCPTGSQQYPDRICCSKCSSTVTNILKPLSITY